MTLPLTPCAGIPDAADSMGYRGSLMFHGSSAEAISSIVAVSSVTFAVMPSAMGVLQYATLW
jgi:hypothetical protein